MEKELESFQDIFGQDILPGHIVAISRANRSALQELAIVLSFGYRNSRYRGKAKIVNLIRLGWTSKLSKGWLSVNHGFNNDVIVIEPGKAFLALNNKRIQSLIKAIDIAKDEGILPSNYTLGKPFSDKQEFVEE